MLSVLNPQLWSALVRRYGEVRIVNQGAPVSWRLRRRRIDGPLEREFLSDGETYKVCCHVCGDRRWRLRFGHRYGLWDPETGSYHWNRVFCFNEGCFASWEAREHLRWQLFHHQPRKAVVKLPEHVVEDDLVAVEWPGQMVRLSQLEQVAPQHLALRYLRRRGFSLQELEQQWDVQICTRPQRRFPLMRNRITIPIYMDGILAAWQGRYPDDLEWRQAGIPKYWTTPGVAKYRLLYNWDVASQHPLVVLVEGPTDAWRVGPSAAALLGKTLTPSVQARLVSYLRADRQRRIVVMLDPDADPKAIARGLPHHQNAVLGRLAAAAPRQVQALWLPSGTDPGSLDRSELWCLIRSLSWNP